MPEPIRTVSAGKYPSSNGNAAAKVRVRLKGETDGPVYQGQVLVIPCATCGVKALAQGPEK